MFLIFPELTSIDEFVQNDQERLWKIYFLDFLTSEFLVQWIRDKIQKLKLLKNVPSLESSAQDERRNSTWRAFVSYPRSRGDETEAGPGTRSLRCEI